MISIQVFESLRKALPRTRLMVSAGEIILIDQNAEVIGQINFKGPGITVFKEYTHWQKVIRRLQKLNIPCEVRETNMQEAMKILYDS